jgi:hypothetical protein
MNHNRWQVIVMVAFAWVLWSQSYLGKKQTFNAIEGYEHLGNCDIRRTSIIKDIQKIAKKPT